MERCGVREPYALPEQEILAFLVVDTITPVDDTFSEAICFLTRCKFTLAAVELQLAFLVVELPAIDTELHHARRCRDLSLINIDSVSCDVLEMELDHAFVIVAGDCSDHINIVIDNIRGLVILNNEVPLIGWLRRFSRLLCRWCLRCLLFRRWRCGLRCWRRCRGLL